MIRSFPAIFALILLSLTATPSAWAQEPTAGTTISGGGLPHSIRLTAVDEDALFRRIDLPSLLDEKSQVSGSSYTVTSAYWDAAVRAGHAGQPQVEPAATYYPTGGLVRTRQGGANVWLSLDLRQRAILDRYIRLAAALTDAPASIEVLRAASASEAIGITIGALELTAEHRNRFWPATQTLRNQPGIVPGGGATPVVDPSATWVIFSLPEGRSIRMRYSPADNTLTEPFGSEVYFLPTNWLVPVVGTEAAPGVDFGLAPLPIPQQESTGSSIWWLFMLGGGVACLGAAAWLQRSWAQNRP